MIQQLRSSRSLLVHAIAVVATSLFLISLGGPLGFLDGRLFYPVAEVAATLDRIGTEGRRLYAINEWIDLFFIALYTPFLIRLRRGGMTPILSLAALDLVETGGILLLLAGYPELPHTLATVVSIATPSKWVSLAWVIMTLFRANQRPPAPRR